MQRTIGSLFTGEGLTKRIQDFATSCDACQRKKNVGPGRGQLPAKDHLPEPFKEVGVLFVAFVSIQPSSILSKFVGDSEARLRHAFSTGTYINFCVFACFRNE